MDKQERAKVYMDYLRGEGFQPTIDSDGDVAFKYEGGNYVVILSDDEEYFQLIYPGFWSLDDGRERAKAEIAAIAATADTKVAKVYPVKDNMWASVEMFYASPRDVCPFIQRSLRALRAAVHKFVSTMQE